MGMGMGPRESLSAGPFPFPIPLLAYFAPALAIELFCLAAAFLWISPLRAARSSKRVAACRISSLASADFAFLRAVRSSERCARLRMAAARDLRRFFLADAILGTNDLQKLRSSWEVGNLGVDITDVKAGL